MTQSQIGILISIVAYLAMMVYIGFRFSKKTKDSGDFYLGGRKLGPFVTAMSAEASDMSGWLLMGLPGVALAGSIAEASWTAIGLAIGTYVNWLIVAKRIRRYTIACNALTVPEFFERRYKDTSRILKIVCAIIIVVFFVPYTASGFSACGKLFSTIFGVGYLPAMIVSAVVIVAYTALGGFLAASTTDLIQSIVMTGALVVVLGFGIYTAGGVGEVINNAKSLEGYVSLDTYVTHSNYQNGVGSYNALTIASTLAWGLGYFGMPHILLRFMAAKKEKNLTLSRRIASIWVVISMFVAIVIGVVGYSLVNNNAINLSAGVSDPESYIAGQIASDAKNTGKAEEDKLTAEKIAAIYAPDYVYDASKSDSEVLDELFADPAVAEQVSKDIYTNNSSVAEKIIVVISDTISRYGFLLALVAGLILAGILASTMSTADSQLLAASSSISEDLMQGVFGIKLSQKKSMLVARLTVIAIAIVGVIIASNENSSVFKIVSFAWAGFGAAFGPVVLLALFWKRSNKWGAIAGVIAGGVMVFVWKFLIAKLGGIFSIYELLPAFLFALIVNVVVSLLTKAPDKEITDTFERVRAGE